MNDQDIAAGVDNYLGNERKIKETTIRDNFVNAANIKPDDFSRQIELSKRTGIPVQSLIANPDEAAKHQALVGTDFSGLVLDSPLTADFLVDPKNAGATRDDTKSLSAMERTTNGVKSVFGALADVIPSINTGVWGLAQAGSEHLIEPFTNLAGSTVGADISGYFKRLRGQAEAASKMAQNFGGNRDEMGVLGRGALNAITSAVQSVLTMPAALEFQLSKGALAMGSAFKAVAPLAAVQGGQSYGEARDKGVGKKAALAYAGAQAATEIWTEMIPMGTLINDLKVGSSLFKALRNQLVEENVGEQFATHFQDLNTWLTVNPDKTLGDYLSERPNAALETLITTTFAAGMQTTAAHVTARVLQKDIAAQDAAKTGGQHIADLFAAAAESMTQKRSPETLQAFIEHVAPGGTVLIDADKLNEVLLQSGVDISRLPSAEAQLATGEVTGSGIEIPLGELVSGLTGTGAEEAIVQHIRLSAELPTMAEEKAFGAQAAAFFQAKADEILEKEAQNADFQLAAKAVQDDLFTQLTAVGRHGPQVNTGYAKLGAAFYSVLANDLGVTPVQVRDGYTDANGREHRGYKLRIGGEPSTGTPLAQGFSHGEAMLNIGLDVGATDRTQKIDAALAKQELEKLGVTVLSGTEIDSPYEKDGETFVEKTYVPHLSRPLTEAEVNHIADVLQQEAIPQYHRGAGNLWGPKAAEWGDFNPEFFKDQSGRSLLSAQGPKQTETPAFKKWFGDSKVVDADGKPLVVYHGTPDDFAPDGNLWFTSDTNAAANYAANDTDGEFKEGANLIPAYIHLTNPLIVDANGAQYDDVEFDEESWVTDDLADEAGRRGHDGLILKNVRDAGDQKTVVDVFYVRKGAQIKSAIGNRGTFDPNDANILNQSFSTVPAQVVEAYRREEAWTEEGSQNGFPTWKSANVELANPRDVTEGHDVFYMPQNGERAVKYDVLNPEGKVVGNTVLEIVDGWPTMLLDIETKPTERSKRYAEHTIAAIANDVGELAIWHIIPSARSWWDRQGATPVDEFNGSLTFETYADVRANRDNPQGVGDPIGFYPSDRGTASRRGSAATGSSSQVLNQAAPLVRAGAVSAPVIGAHFSRQPRSILGSSYFGTGLKGAEAERLAQSNDSRIKQRIAFYIDEGSGVHPEPGVGGAAHVATLTNLYDADADTLKLFRRNQRDLNAAESAILDAGFDGYLQRKNFTNQGTAVLLGARSVEAEHVGGIEEVNARVAPPPPADIPAMKTLAIQLVNDRTLPGGALLPAEWEQEVAKRDSPIAKLVDWSKFDPNERLYKDEVARQLWQTSETWYYSQLTRAIENASDKVFTTGKSVSQWLVSNAGKLGVKKEELEFTGITDWLELQGKVSRADVVAFMREGGVKVEEVVLGQPDDDLIQAFLDDESGEGFTREEAIDYLMQDQENASLTKFQQYQLPGGENYRELLITLPTEEKIPQRKHWLLIETATDNAVAARATEPNQAWLDKVATGEFRIEEEMVNDEQAADRQGIKAFRSSHFDQPNILAHVRMNERTDAEGARVLFVEEVQSDWGQKGKKAGFRVSPEREAELRSIMQVAEVAGNNGGATQEQMAAWVAAANELQPDTIHRKVPTAPFVTDTKAWTGLAVKRVLAYAAENGFDKVAWTTGEQQAERYDLSKQVDEIVALPNTDGTYDLTINLESGGSQQLRGLTESGLEDNIGKDLAKKIVSDSKEYLAANKAYRNALKEGATEDVLDRLLAEKDAVRRTYSGLDLKVGGEGMKGFYDGILPQVVRDVLKKVGGGKLEDVQLASAAFENAEDDELLAELGAATEGARPKYQPGFTITPAMREAVSKGLPLFQPTSQAPKLGSFDPKTLDLTLLADANYSTFVHELGHFFLTAYADVAAQEGAPQKVVDGMAAILKQFGVPDLATWHAMTLEQQRPYHEQLAESFEQYVMTGKAPSLELQPLFSTMLAWFKKVYQSIRDFVAGHSGARLNPELAAVFDRMLATDAEIELANAARGYVALFKDAAEGGMSDADFAAYTALSDAQREDAESMLRSRSLRDMKWLQARRNKIIATLQEEAKEKRAEMRKAVAAEVRAEPIRQAERYLKHGVVLNDVGADIAPLGPNKLQISEVKTLYPEEALTPQPDITKLGYGKYGMLVETGLSPDEVATRFGIASGSDLVNELLGLTKLNDEIEARTDQRMLEQYGDLSSPQAMARAADEAIHNDFRTKAVATELSALAANIGSPTVLMKAAKEYARQVLATKTSRTLKPWSYAAAETRAGKAAMAALKKGDRDLAATEKRTELVNHVTTKEAYAVEKEIKKIVDRFRKLASYNNESSAVKSRDFATVQAVRAILADHGIGSKGESAAAYLDLVKEYDPAAAGRLQEIIDVTSANPKDWSDITVANLRELSDAIDSMWFLAARGKQMEVQGKMVSQKAIAEELHETLVDQGVPKRVPGEGWAPTRMEKLGMKFGAWKATLRRMEFIASHLDGNRLVGPWMRNIVGVVQDATAAMNIAKADTFKRYEALLKSIAPTLGRGEIAAPELGYVFGRGPSGSGLAELLHAILHTGNESNMRKMLLGRQWATEFNDGSLNTAKWDAFVTRMKREGRLTKAHYDFAQGVWDLMESLKPAAQKTHRIVFGKYFSEITANSFKNEFGTYAGGYVPALTDSDIVKDNDLRKLQEAALSEMTFAFPAPAKGFTNARVEGYTRELKLDLNALSGHISQVLAFSYMAVPVNDIRRVLSRPEIANTINRLYPGLIVEAINPWLVRVAKNTVSPLASDVSNFLRLARSRAGTNTMMGSLSNAVQQVVGVLPATVSVEGKYLRRAVVDGLVSPTDTQNYVKGLSPYMRTRIDYEVNAAMDTVDQILTNPSVYQSTVAWTRRHAYFLQSAVDNTLSPMIWLAAFNQATDQGAAEADAVHIADSVIRRTQGASAPADIAAFEAGTPFLQLFTQFTGYFNMMAQFLQGEWVKNRVRDVGLPKKYARAFYIVAIGFYAQAVAAELVSMLFRGGPADDDKDDQVIDDWLFQLGIMAPTKFVLSAVPFLGAAAQVVVNKFNTKPYDDKMLNSPVISTLEQGLGSPVATYKAVMEEGKPSVAIRGLAGIIGLFTGLPTAVAARPIGYAADVAAGKVNPTGAFDFTRGIITGTASPDSKR